MLLANKQNLDDLLVQLLALQPNIDVNSICRILKKNKTPYSKSSIYQELRKLRDQDVVVVYKGNYSLRLGWINELNQFFKKVQEEYLTSEHLIRLLPQESEKLTLEFKDINSLLVYWGQLMITLANNNTSSKFFESMPYAPWLFFSEISEQSVFNQIFKDRGIEYYLMIGGESSLNSLVKDSCVDLKGEVSTAKSPFYGETNSYHMCSDSYVLVVDIPSKIHNQLKVLHEKNWKDISSFNKEIERVTKLSGTFRLTVFNDKDRSERIFNQFKDFFGF